MKGMSMPSYQIWAVLVPIFFHCRSAFRDHRCFHWACIVVMAFCCGLGPNGGVTEMIRIIGLSPNVYTSLLGFFESSAILLEQLSSLWLSVLLKKSNPIKLGDYILFAVDEIKVGKEGKKMPSVKYLHQSSENNSKPKFIMGHNIAVIALAVRGILGETIAMPIFARILGGIKQTPKEKKTFVDSIVQDIEVLIKNLDTQKAIFVADALYCIRSFIKPLVQKGIHVISRVKKNAVAYKIPTLESKPRRGRKRKYGDKIKLSTIFDNISIFKTIASPIPGETNQIQYHTMQLIPDWLGLVVTYIFVIHPKRGKIILLSTNSDLNPIEVYLAYYHRFQIEISFKNLVYVIGAFTYKFWTKAMKPLRRGETTRYTHKETPANRERIFSKLRSYHIYLTLACIACSLNQFAAQYYPQKVWSNFGGWLRTIRPNSAPSIEVTAEALRASLPAFLASNKMDGKLGKFIDEKSRSRGQPKKKAA